MEKNKNNNNNKINRRDFFKLAGAGTLASATALYGCSGQKNSSDSESAASGEIPTDKMVYRTNPTTGDRVSILGYGCMRWPTRKRADGNGDEVDQETVNELVDYAIAHGVNYFDTSPVYVQGWSEKSTGIALKRHPREKFLIATKLSNFSNYTRENSIAMYRKSFEDLQVDYLDYYLLHSVGNGGIKTFRARYIDNGMIDFLMEERKAGRIRNLGFSFHGTVDVFDEILAMHDRIHWDFVQIQLNYADWKHASGNNVNAEYLYGELVKRGIPAIIMEPLLGGRLSKLNDHLVARLKQHRPQSSTASWAFRFAGTFPNVLTVLSGMTYMEHLQEIIREDRFVQIIHSLNQIVTIMVRMFVRNAQEIQIRSELLGPTMRYIYTETPGRSLYYISHIVKQPYLCSSVFYGRAFHTIQNTFKRCTIKIQYGIGFSHI